MTKKLQNVFVQSIVIRDNRNLISCGSPAVEVGEGQNTLTGMQSVEFSIGFVDSREGLHRSLCSSHWSR